MVKHIFTSIGVEVKMPLITLTGIKINFPANLREASWPSFLKRWCQKTAAPFYGLQSEDLGSSSRSRVFRAVNDPPGSSSTSGGFSGPSVPTLTCVWAGSWGRFNVVVSAFQTAAPFSKAASAGRPTWAWPFLSVLSSKTCLWTSVWTCAPRRWGALFVCGLFVPENVLWCRISVPGKNPGRAVGRSMSLRLPVPSLLPPWAGERGRVCPPVSRRRVWELRQWRVLCGVPNTGSR